MTQSNIRAETSRWQHAVVFIAAALIALFFGALTGMGAYPIVASLALAVPGIFLLMRPDISLIFFMGLTLLVAGTLKYFFGLGQFQWGLSILGSVLLAYALIKKLFSTNSERFSADGISHLIVLWWAILIYSSMANALPALDWIVGIRIYLPVFGVFAYVAYCQPTEKLLKKVFLFMMAIATVQWFFSLYQKLFIVPLRVAGHYPGSAWDSIVGTFGGEKFGGGESGSLGIYLSIIMIFAAALIKYRQIATTPFLVVFITGFAAMAIVESKVIAMMIPIGMFFVYRDYLLRRPAKFFIGMFTIAGLMFLLLVVYYYLYWQTDNQKGLFDALYDRFSYSFNPQFQASATNLGRIKSLLFWWDNHSVIDNPFTLLLGHGLASAVSASTVIGEGTAVHSFNVMLDVTGASKLLWESGVFGLLVFLLIFVAGFYRAQSLKTDSLIPDWHRAALTGIEAAMVLMPLSIFYEVTVVSSPPMQFTAMFLLGYVSYWWRETAGARRG